MPGTKDAPAALAKRTRHLGGRVRTFSVTVNATFTQVHPGAPSTIKLSNLAESSNSFNMFQDVSIVCNPFCAHLDHATTAGTLVRRPEYPMAEGELSQHTHSESKCLCAVADELQSSVGLQSCHGLEWCTILCHH